MSEHAGLYVGEQLDANGARDGSAVDRCQDP